MALNSNVYDNEKKKFSARGDCTTVDVSLIDASGVQITSFGGGCQYAEDTALGATPTGTLSMARRCDTLDTLTPVLDDAVSLRTTSRGALWISHDGSIGVCQGTASNLCANVNVCNTPNVGTVTTVTNLVCQGGVAISLNTGVRDTGTQRVTIATNDLVPVCGTITAVTSITNPVCVCNTTASNLCVDTELIAVAALADTVTNPTVTSVGTYNSLFNGTTWDRMRGDTTNGLDVDVTRLPTLVAGTANIGNVGQCGTWNIGTVTAVTTITNSVAVCQATAANLCANVSICNSALPSGAATSACQGEQTTSLQLIDDVIFTDDAAFTPATSKVAMIGAELDDTSPDVVDEGDAGALRMTSFRALHTNLRNVSGTEIGTAVTPLHVGYVGIPWYQFSFAGLGIGAVAITDVSTTVTPRVVSTANLLTAPNGVVTISREVWEDTSGNTYQRINRYLQNETFTTATTGTSVNTTGEATDTHTLVVFQTGVVTAWTVLLQGSLDSGTNWFTIATHTNATGSGVAVFTNTAPATMLRTNVTLLTLGAGTNIKVQWVAIRT
jgi:hypothetical protein